MKIMLLYLNQLLMVFKMPSKKAQLGIQWLYWTIYIFITAIFVGLVRFLPAIYFATAIDTYNIENTIYNERVFQELSNIDNLTLRHNYGVSDVALLSDDRFSNTFSNEFDKKLAFKISVDGKTAFFNKNFYDRARPLAPVRYKIFNSKKPIVSQNNIVLLNIEQVFTHTLKPEQNE